MKSNIKSKINLKIKSMFIGLFLIATIMIAGCVAPANPANPSNQGNSGNQVNTQEGLLSDNSIKESTFKTLEEYQNFVKDHEGTSGMMYYARDSAMMEKTTVVAGAMAPTASPISANGGSTDYSQTNNQVAGVDEADMLKTDGEYIYTITENTVFIVKSYPGANAQVVSTIKLNDTPVSLFVEGNKLAVMGYVTQFDFLNSKGFSRDQGYVFMNIYDLTDKAKPKLVKELKFEGQYNDARLIGSEVYLISTFYPQYRAYPTPILFDGTVEKSMPVGNIHYFNIPYSNPYLVIANSVNLNSLTTTDSEAITVEGYPNVYMSENNLYLSYTEYISEYEIQQDIMMNMIVPKLSSEDQAYILKVKNTDNDILSSYEKKAKILQVVEKYYSSLPQNDRDALQNSIDTAVKAKLAEYKYMEYTIINKLSVSSGQISVVANGKVPGSILNQFSMDEYNGNLRIATTISQRWSMYADSGVATDIAVASDSSGSGSTGSDIASSKMIAPSIMPPQNGFSDSANNLYVLNSGLKVIGSIEGLAKGEQIYSVRFMEDRAYVVTFRQIDPFFAIDLKDPFAPKVLGTLKIPGFSRYLHPYDKNIVIGIGRDATDAGRQEGLKISLFDVTDIANPKEIAKYVSDEKYAGSTAEWEHKAFLFSKEKNLLVIPVYNYDYTNPGNDMNGALVFNITKNSITLRGLIDHSGNTQYGPNVERSLYISDMLYTKSPYLLRVNALSDLSSVKNVTLSTKDTSGIKVY
jgi:inhibitor of cysteine peptidase